MTAEEILASIARDQVEFLDLKFVDLPGTWHHITVPTSQIDEDTFTRGVPFDGSSLRGFREIEESDMVLMPDPATAFVDPFMDRPTISVTAEVLTPDLAVYDRDPRGVARRAESYLKATGVADTAYFGPELEFFVFDRVGYSTAPHDSFYMIDSEEAIWGTGEPDGNLGYRIRPKEGYTPVAPHDALANLRNEVVSLLKASGMRVERHHHEVATAGQSEIGFGHDTLLRTADNVLLYKYIVKNTAQAHGKTATFMPKPIFGDNGSGMHTHQSLWKDGAPLFADSSGYAGISAIGLSYVAGILAHAPALVGLVNASTNSFKRLVPGFEAPVDLVFSKGNRSAAVRIPIAVTSPKTTRIEFRTPDSTGNPYLAFAAMMMAGLDGVRRKLDPTAMGFGPLEKNIYHLSAEERAAIRSVPASLEAALSSLEADHDFLLEGGVFSEDLIQDWITMKRDVEVKQVNLRPTPYEYYLYFDI